MSKYNALLDEKLVILLAKDDQLAFAEIYNRYAESLTGFVSSKLSSLDDARDIIHDVFLKLWNDRKRLTINKNFKAYLFTSVRNLIIDKFRKNAIRENYADMVLALQASADSGIEEQLSVKELNQQISKALNKMAPREKEIYHLSREENLSNKQIAEKLGLSEQTVKNQISIALKHLKSSLNYHSIFVLILYFYK